MPCLAATDSKVPTKFFPSESFPYFIGMANAWKKVLLQPLNDVKRFGFSAHRKKNQEIERGIWKILVICGEKHWRFWGFCRFWCSGRDVIGPDSHPADAGSPSFVDTTNIFVIATNILLTHQIYFFSHLLIESLFIISSTIGFVDTTNIYLLTPH